jgi:hypothetical protein
LGDDSNCETCGWSYNTATLELWDKEEDIWQLSYSVGCYSGEGIMSNEPEWNTKVEKMINHLLTFEYFGKTEEKELRKKLKLVGETK